MTTPESTSFRAYLLSFLEGLWNVAPVYIFLDKIVFALSLGVIFGVWAVDPMKLDLHYKIGISVITLGIAYVSGHAIYRYNQSGKPQTVLAGKSKDSFELIGTIYGVGTGIPSSEPSTTSVFIIANVRNAGEATVVTDWVAKVTTLEGKTIQGKSRYIYPDHPVRFSTEAGQTMQYSPEDALYLKATNEPLGSGGQIVGLLIFDLVNTKQLDVARAGTVVTLTFNDVKGNTYSASYTLPDRIDDGMRYYPGMKPPFQTPSN
jgi:hypothetical protein